MTHPDEAPPPLPKLLFFGVCAGLLATAFLITRFAADPFAPVPLIAATACVALSALLCLIPFISEHIRAQERALAERQASLEALGRSVAESTETLSIAAAGLHTIAETAARAAQAAEALPATLTSRLGELGSQLEQRTTDDRDGLEQELAALRATRTEQLVDAVDRLQKTVAELARLEHTLARALAPLHDTKQLSTAVTEATRELRTTLGTAAVEAGRAAAGELQETLAATASRAATAAVRDLTNAATPLADRLAGATENLTRATSIIEAATENLTAIARRSRPPFDPSPSSAPAEEAPITPRAIMPVTPDTPEPFSMRSARTAFVPAPEPALKPKHLPASTAPAAISSPSAPASASPEPTTPDPATPATESSSSTPPAVAPPSAVAPTVAPFPVVTAIVEPPTETSVAAPASPPPSPDTRRRTAARRTAEAGPELDLGLPPPIAPTESPPPPVATTDGHTRLFVTAYIGIGNRLFLRGTGPGLDPQRGVPLQFISIGKWRWETPDATAPLTLRLFKNDQVECTALGEITVPAGHQQEVTARF